VLSCKYHIVWCPKYRRKVLVEAVAERLTQIIREICHERQVEVLSLEIMSDHVHLFGGCDLQSVFIDAGWGQFQQMCVSKAAYAGRTVLFVDPTYTSQVCSQCGTVRKKDLFERWHSCQCGCELDRDTNAAKNILRLAQLARKEPTSAMA